MNSATLEAPKQTDNGRRSRRDSTPKPMLPKNAGVAISTPEEIDIPAVVANIMLIKGKEGGYGDRMVTKKGLQHVFALACAQIKSMLGMEAKTEDGKPVHLPDAVAAKVKEAIGAVLDQQWNRFRTYGGSLDTTDIKWTWDKPKFTIIAPEKSTVTDKDGNKLRDLDLRWKATAVTTRESKDLGEEILCAYAVKSAAEKRLENMDKKPGEYTREQKREVHDLISLAVWKIGHLEARKRLEARKKAAVAELDMQKSLGKLTEEQYAEARNAIESAKE